MLHAQYGYPTGWAALLAAADLGLPSVVSIQGGDGHWVGSCCATHYHAFRRVLDHASALLIGGASFVGEVSERMGVPPARFTRVPGAVDTARFRPGHAPGSVAAVPRLLYHGRVDRRKGVLDFIEALVLLRAEGVPFAATISGIGPDAEPARALAAERGFAPDAVRFTGYADYDARAGPLRGSRHLRLADLCRGLLQHHPGGDGRRPAGGELRRRRRRRLPARRRQRPADGGRATCPPMPPPCAA